MEFAVIRNFPNSGDEYAYLISAELFSRGKLSVPSPALPRFFDVMHVVNDGKFYGKYPPGWPAVLAAGVFLGIPWIVNPLLGALTVIAVYRTARRHFSIEAANLAAIILASSPYFIFNSASYFSHSACLLAVCLAFSAAFDIAERPEGRRAYLELGLSGGLAFAMRPFTAVILLALPAAYVIFQFRHVDRRASLLRGLAWALPPALLCLGLFLAYNRAMTGELFLQPFEKYAPWDVPGIPRTGSEWASRLKTHMLARSWDLNRWLALSPVLLVLGLCLPATRRDPRVWVIAGSFAALFVAYLFYWGEGGFQYGPRYLYESAGGLSLVCALVVASYGFRGAPMLLAILLLDLATMAAAVGNVSEEVALKRDVYLRAREQHLDRAIVFMRTGSGPAPLWDCPRNGIDFNLPVLFVRDLGDSNRLLLGEYPDRASYMYEYDSSRHQGRLIPYTSAPRIDRR